MSKLVAPDAHEFLKDKPAVDDVIEFYLRIRNELDIERKKYNDYEQGCKAAMYYLSQYLKDVADSMGLDTLSSKNHGTAFRTKKTRYSVDSWDDLVEYIKETGNFQVLEKRVAKLATQEIHDDEGLPPGVEYFEEEEFQVRKPTRRG